MGGMMPRRTGLTKALGNWQGTLSLALASLAPVCVAPAWGQAGSGQPGQSFTGGPAQTLPGGPAQSLNAALARLGRDPRDLVALIDAGNAALAMGDVDAAIGFFGRADQLSPNNARVKAGLAGALVRSEN